ncbi:hypothetical protein HDU77_011610 [Chytriomyces hyalinus]|nr:hypothetical protein HDU77_011610 [Chytriomyces hyalinus]
MWSLGVLLFTMVFGENPFTMADTIQSHFVMPQGFALDSDSDSQPGETILTNPHMMTSR